MPIILLVESSGFFVKKKTIFWQEKWTGRRINIHWIWFFTW